jgi:hypothetical protein
MFFRKKKIFPVLYVVVFLLFANLTDKDPQQLPSAYRSMEGTLYTHFFEDKTDSLSGPELYELRDKNGLPIWFGRHIFKDVCISGECKMIRLWLFWDGAGNYLGMHIPEHEPLTKSDHTEFEPGDYEKLENILLDKASLLKDLKQEELVIIPGNINPYEVDGYTAATRPGLEQLVVKDAVYTCHTLWHTVYGPVRDEIHRITDQRISTEFLRALFDSRKPEYVALAIEGVQKHPEYHAGFTSDILEYIGSDNTDLANQALGYFHNGFLADSAMQHNLVQVMADADINIRNEILWKFAGLGQIHQNTVLQLLEMFSRKKLNVGSYNLVLRLIRPEHLRENEQMVFILDKLSKDENGYVRNLTKKVLAEMGHSAIHQSQH